jgi:hypothetical protein
MVEKNNYKLFVAFIFLIISFIYLIVYISIRNYSHHGTKDSTFGTIGFNAFSYFENINTRIYPNSKSDAEWLFINNSNANNSFNIVYIIFVPLERIELAMRGQKIVVLSNEEKLLITHRIEMFDSKKINSMPY